MFSSIIVKKIFPVFVLVLFFVSPSKAQLINYDLRELRKEWGNWEFEKANTARFSIYMRRSQKQTVLFMNLARQDGKKFTELVTKPYTQNNPQKEYLFYALNNNEMPMLYPSFRLWLGAVPHAVISGVIGSKGHQGFKTRLYATLNLNKTGENCDYGHSKGIEVTLHLITSPPHRASILNKDFSRAAVSKFPHTKYKWNSVTTFSGPKFFDMTLRGHSKIKHLQANVGYATDFKQSIIDISVGMRHNNNLNSARWAVGAEILPRIDSTLIAPKIQWANEYLFFGFGASVLSFLPVEKYGVVARPEISFRLPFTIKVSKRTREYELLNIEKSRASIGITYGYNINLLKDAEMTLGKHQVTLTYSRNFLFSEKKR
jgi:hypothetical protein